MNPKVEKLFYGLSIFLLMMLLFIMQPFQRSATNALQSQMRHQLARAWQQTIGDQPYFDNFSLVYDGVNAFYHQAAAASISTIKHSDSDQALVDVFRTTYWKLTLVFTGNRPIALVQISPEIASEVSFMTQAAIYNIVPEQNHESWIMKHESGQVAGISMPSTNPVNSPQNPWVTIQDNFTGQFYCLAVYNGEVNKYLGNCKNDYY